MLFDRSGWKLSILVAALIGNFPEYAAAKGLVIVAPDGSIQIHSAFTEDGTEVGMARRGTLSTSTSSVAAHKLSVLAPTTIPRSVTAVPGDDLATEAKAIKTKTAKAAALTPAPIAAPPTQTPPPPIVVAPAQVEAPVAEALAAGLSFRFDGVLFDTDMHFLKPEAGPVLDALAEALNAQPRITVRVEGHTDNRGSAPYNLELSKRRADSVAAALLERGVAAARMQVQGYGLTFPIATNDTEEGRALNRRVDVVPITH